MKKIIVLLMLLISISASAESLFLPKKIVIYRNGQYVRIEYPKLYVISIHKPYVTFYPDGLFGKSITFKAGKPYYINNKFYVDISNSQYKFTIFQVNKDDMGIIRGNETMYLYRKR